MPRAHKCTHAAIIRSYRYLTALLPTTLSRTPSPLIALCRAVSGALLLGILVRIAALPGTLSLCVFVSSALAFTRLVLSRPITLGSTLAAAITLLTALTALSALWVCHTGLHRMKWIALSP